MLTIRKGTYADVEAVMACYEAARRYMRASGNYNQWINGYPSREHVIEDIRAGVNYVGEDPAGELVVAFAFIIGEDPTYAVIEEGEWLNPLPYGTIHRIGSNGKYKGILRECVDFCASKIGNLRLDTHADNLPMQKAAERLGFVRCGIIHCMDGSPRVAYQKNQY